MRPEIPDSFLTSKAVCLAAGVSRTSLQRLIEFADVIPDIVNKGRYYWHPMQVERIREAAEKAAPSRKGSIRGAYAKKRIRQCPNCGSRQHGPMTHA